jgi:hypothetical protein
MILIPQLTAASSVMSGYNVAIDQEDEGFLVEEVMSELAILQ